MGSRSESKCVLARGALFAAFVLLSGAGDLVGQMVGPRMASRAELNRMLDSLKQSPGSVRDEDQQRVIDNQISGLEYRLSHGDIWAGDVVDLWVSGEDRWTAQFTVTPRRDLELPDVDPVPLEGVLLSELEESMALALARYLREPRIRATVLKRIGILGEVGNPGFYAVSGSALVSEVVMLAGGPTGNADVDDIEFRRFGDRIAEGRPNVVWQSLSLDQLGVNSGDEVYVPTRPRSFGGLLAAGLGTTLTIAFLLTRIF